MQGVGVDKDELVGRWSLVRQTFRTDAYVAPQGHNILDPNTNPTPTHHASIHPHKDHPFVSLCLHSFPSPNKIKQVARPLPSPRRE